MADQTAPTTPRPCVSYLRVSTARQGRSGLGLEAQRARVAEFVEAGRCTELVEEFVEVESGSKSARPELEKALAACRIRGARLVVAKLDRLARNAAFLLSLRDSGVDFVAADMPEANRLTVGILAVVAEAEREAISKRTSEALAAARDRGVELGTPENLTDADRRKGARVSAEVRSARADQRAADLRPIVEELRAEGRESLRQLAVSLDERGIRTPRGAAWTPAAVRRVLVRLDRLDG